MTEEEIKMNRRKMHELLDIVLDTNGFEERRREYTGTLPTVFFRISGQVASAELSLHADGWESFQNPDEEWEVSFDRPIDVNIESIRETCKEALKTDKECETLSRDIDRTEKEIAERKKELSKLKKSLREARKRETA